MTNTVVAVRITWLLVLRVRDHVVHTLLNEDILG